MKRLWRLLYYARRYCAPGCSPPSFWPPASDSSMLSASCSSAPSSTTCCIRAPASRANKTQLLGSIGARWHINITPQILVPSFLHIKNDWGVIAFAFVASTLLKGICDYTGTYLANYAGFGMITDMRDDLYESILRRSVAFFQKHTTGTLLSALINDIERVQYATSTDPVRLPAAGLHAGLHDHHRDRAGGQAWPGFCRSFWP